MPRQHLGDFVSWRAARALAAAVHRSTTDAAFERDPELRTELRAAATAIMTTIAQGCEQKTCGEFERCLVTALGATARLESLVFLAQDMRLLTRDASERMRARVTETSRLIDTLRQAILRYQQLQTWPAPERVN
jgi:four helix bundle protein